MSTTRRRRFSAELKAKVALESIRGEQSIQELASRYELHSNMITTCKFRNYCQENLCLRRDRIATFYGPGYGPGWPVGPLG